MNIIDYLPDSVEELVLEWGFNLELNDLPSSIKKLIINSDDYVHELNCLPNNLEYLKLPNKYTKIFLKFTPLKYVILMIKLIFIKNNLYKVCMRLIYKGVNLLEFQVYDKEIKKYPKQLKTIKCHIAYKYIDKLKQNGLKIETYG